MALAVDAATPARATLTHSGAGGSSDPFTGTTASATPPATALWVVCVSCDSAGTTQNETLTVSNSGTALTWTVAVERDPTEATQGGYAAIAWAKDTSGAAKTVTASVAGHGLSAAAGASRGSVKAYLVTGHNTTTPNGATAEGNSTTNNYTTSPGLTTTAANSLVFFAGNDWAALGTPASSDLTADTFNIAGVVSGLSGYKSVASSGSSATANLDAAGASAAAWNWAGLEIMPAGAGGPTLTGSSRGQGATNTAAQTTLAITPASNLTAGAMAHLTVAYDNSGASGADPFSAISDTKGNTWTARRASLNDPGAANAGNVLRTFTTPQNGGALTTADTITVSFGGIVTVARAWVLQEAVSSVGVPVYKTGASATGSSTTPTITSSSIPSGHMIVGSMGAQGNAAITADSDTVNGSWGTQQTAGIGTTTAGMEVASQQKVATAAGAQTYNLTITTTTWSVGWDQIGEALTATPPTKALATAAFAPTVQAPRLSTPPVTPLSLTKFAPTVSAPRTATPNRLALSLVTFAAVVSVGGGKVVTPPTKAMATTTLAPTVSVSDKKTATPGLVALVATKFAPTVLAPRLATPGVKALALTAFAPTIVNPKVAVPPTKVLTITRFAPTLNVSQTFTPPTLALVTTKFAPSVQAPRVVIPGVKALATATFAPVATASDTKRATPPTAALALTPYAPSALSPRLATPGLATLALAGYAPTVSTASTVPPDFDPVVAWWRMDEASGTRRDLSGFGRTLSPVGGPSRVVGLWRYAVSSPTTADYLEYTGIVVTDPTAFTFGGVFYIPDTAGNYPLFGQFEAGSTTNRQYVRTEAATFRVDLGAGGTFTAGVVTAGAWHHVFVTYNQASGTAILYVDGIGTSNAATAVTLPTTGRVTRVLGSRLGVGAGSGVRACLVGAWNRALSATDINGLYNGGDGLDSPFDTSLRPRIVRLGRFALTAPAPTVPAILDATAASTTSINVVYTPSVTAGGYHELAYRKSGRSEVRGDVGNTGSYSLSASLEAASEYALRLRKRTPFGWSAWAPTRVVNTPGAPGVPLADFSADDTTPAVDQSIQFTDLSTGVPTSWLWDFGDGSTSTAQNPTHAYTIGGTYTVSLTATNAFGSNQKTRVGYLPAAGANFTAAPLDANPGSTVTVTDTSVGTVTAFSIDWGDGTVNSTLTHIYGVAGTYTIAYTATIGGVPSTRTRTGYVVVAPWLTTVFSGSQSLTTSHVQAALVTLDPASYPIAAGYTRQYRWAFDFSGTVAGFDQLEGTEFRSPVYHAAGVVQNAGWLDESGGGWWLNPTAAGWSWAAGAVSLDGTTRLLGPMFAPGAFTAEAQFTLGRTGQYEAILSTWSGSAGRWLAGINATGKPQLNIVTPAGAGIQVTATNAVVGGPHWMRVVSDDSTYTHLLIDGVVVCTTANSPKHNANKRGFAFGLGGDGDNSNRFLGTIHQARYSNAARDSGGAYTPAALTDDANALGLWTFASAPAALSVTTAWLPFPAASTAVSVRARNKTAARGTLTGVTLEVRATATDVELSRYQTTPIIAYGSGSYDASDNAAPHVFHDTANNRWVCDYSTYSGSLWTLSLAYATYNAAHADGIQGLSGPWTREATNPVMVSNAPTEGYICCNSSIIPKSGTWYHFYNGNDDSISGRTNMFLSTSTDYGLTWTRANGGAPVMSIADTGPDQVADPNAISGTGLDSDGNFVLYWVTSNSLATRETWRGVSSDGINWTCQRMFGPPPMSTLNIGEPTAYEAGSGVVYMLHDTSDSTPNSGRRLLDIYTADGWRTWSARRNRLTESANVWETGQVFDACRLKVGSKGVVIYAGSVGIQSNQGMHSSLGLAVGNWDDGRI